MKVFKNDNEAYQKWIISNPNAYVVNTKPDKSHNYRVAHRTSCRYIVGSNYPARSTKLYIKVCSEDPKEIANWFTSNKTYFDGTFHECGKCLPQINQMINTVENTEQK